MAVGRWAEMCHDQNEVGYIYSRMHQNMPRQDAGGQKCVMAMAGGQEGMVSGIDCCIKGSNNSPCDPKEEQGVVQKSP